MLTIEPQASPGVITLLKANTIGTPGESILYKHKTYLQKLTSIGNHHFVSLKRGEHVIGTVCLCRRQIMTGGKVQQARYIRYFTFNEKYCRKGGEKSQWKLKGKLKEAIQLLLDGYFWKHQTMRCFMPM